MGVASDWIEHRRADKELVGWIVPAGDRFDVVDLLGRRSTGFDWLTAEEHLEMLGIGYLADRYTYTPSVGHSLRVKIVEVSPAAIVVQDDTFGDAVGGPPADRYTLAWPIPPQLIAVGS